MQQAVRNRTPRPRLHCAMMPSRRSARCLAFLTAQLGCSSSRIQRGRPTMPRKDRNGRDPSRFEVTVQDGLILHGCLGGGAPHLRVNLTIKRRILADLQHAKPVIRPRSHGPPWECRLRRSASPAQAPAPRTQSVPDGIPTRSVGTRISSGLQALSQSTFNLTQMGMLRQRYGLGAGAAEDAIRAFEKDVRRPGTIK